MSYSVIDEETPVSSYVPSEDEKALVVMVQKQYNIGHNILTKGWSELNGNSVLTDMDMGRKMFNAFVDVGESDVASDWRWKGTRSEARKKGIAMHANLTAGYLMPTFQAQNDKSDLDRGFSEFMSDLVEWMAQDENSDYKTNFLSLVVAMETDPIVYLGAEFHEVYQDIKIKQESGKYETKEILDEVLSGFKAPIYTADQILFTNAFERNLQKQTCLIKRRWIDYEEAKALYGEHENWDSVRKGGSAFYNESDGLFYDIKDQDHPNLVEEVTYLNRRKDLECVFLGGVYVGDENIDQNRIRHRDNFDAPRYNVQQFGFYPIGSHFIFYKSMMATLRWDNELYDAMTQIAMNRAVLDTEMPIAVSGSDKVDQDIIYPNAVIAMKDKDTKVSPLLPQSNLGNIFAAIRETKDSIAEGSVNETISGQLPAASQKAYSVAQAQSNAKIIIGGVAKGLAASVSRFGLLMADLAINKLSPAQIDEIVGDETKLKYRSFILSNKVMGGQRMDKRLVFSEDLIGMEMTNDEKRSNEIGMYADSKKKGNAVIYANPEMFAKFKYYSRADYREVFAQNDEQMQALLTALEAQMRDNPYANQEEITKELMYSYFHSKGERFVQKPQPQQPMVDGSGMSQQFAQSVQSKTLAGATANAGLR